MKLQDAHASIVYHAIRSANHRTMVFLHSSLLSDKFGRALATWGPFVLSIPNRRNTSEQVTRIEIQMSTMMIQVIRDILSSEI